MTGTAINGAMAVAANAAGKPAPAITAPIAGVVIAVARYCAVFCTARPRPLHLGPAYSAMAVNARPLSATDAMVAITMTTTATGEPIRSRAASAAVEANAVSAIQRTGRIREPTTSETRPAPIRPSVTRMQVMNLLRGMLASMRDNLGVSFSSSLLWLGYSRLQEIDHAT